MHCRNAQIFRHLSGPLSSFTLLPMNNPLTTHCTHCDTGFRLLPEQLEAAQGMVRCGACRNVFNAFDKLDMALGQQPPAEEMPTNGETALHESTDVDLDNPEFDHKMARLVSEERQGGATEPEKLVFGTFQDNPDTLQDTPDLPEPPYDEEAWAAALLAEEGFHPDSGSQDGHREEVSETSLFWQDEAQAPQHEQEPLLREELASLAPDPLELAWKPRPVTWKKNLLWSLLILLALSGLATQYAYFNFDSLVRSDYGRVWMQRLCPLLGCPLPDQVNVEHIKTSNLMVRKHPDYQDALLIDAVIYNRAAYAQGYPLIKLNFLSADNQTLASRTFRPAEYLGGELAGSRQMPAQVPIRIAFEVLLPTRMAENYSLEFLSP